MSYYNMSAGKTHIKSEILENFNINENDKCELIEIVGNKWENHKW